MNQNSMNLIDTIRDKNETVREKDISLAEKDSQIDVLKDFILSISTGPGKKRVLHPDSSQLWFKRGTGGSSHIYGLSKGIQQHLCPITHLPNKLKKALILKCQDIIDDSEILDHHAKIVSLRSLSDFHEISEFWSLGFSC